MSRSFRFHRPRGPVCGRGYCHQCEVPTASGRELACQASPEAAGATRRRSAPLRQRDPLRRWDPLRPLGWLAERFPPWFYESRLLRPAPLRGLSLHLLRHLSAAPALSGLRPTPPVPGGSGASRPLAGSAASGALAGSAASGPQTESWISRVTANGHTRSYSEVEAEVVVVGSAAGHPGAYRVDLAEGTLAIGLYPGRLLGVASDRGVTAVRFGRIVLATGSYDRLPPVAGNDLPGVIGLAALDRYGTAGALPAGTPVAIWAPADQQDQAAACAERYGLPVAWMGERCPERIHGRRRVTGIATADGPVRCGLFVTAVRQPAIELAMQGGATAELTADGLPVISVTRTPDWMELAGSAALRTSGVPDVAADDRAFACMCEDVRVGDLKKCVTEGFRDAELIKRRTGAMTGPCQGKLCSATVLAVLRDLGCAAAPTRVRPLARPVSLRELAADG